jgi:peroxiredoxin
LLEPALVDCHRDRLSVDYETLVGGSLLMNSIVDVGLVALWLLVAGQTWLLYRILSEQRNLAGHQANLESHLQDVENALMSLPVQAQAQQAPASLDVGVAAPDLSLPDLNGKIHNLKEFLGGPLVVCFFSPTCGFCLELAARLGQLPEGSARTLVITTGNADDNLRLAKQYGWRCDVLLDSSGEAIRAYKIPGTPAGYLLAADGRVASEIGVGVEAVLALATSSGGGQDSLTPELLREKQEKARQRAQNAGLGLTESRLKRDGLEPGVKAPEFVLPDLSGKKRSLSSFLDKRVLLVFSDPNCGPCDALAPDLVRLHREYLSDGLRVVMVSRGDPAANQAKAQKHEYPFPVLLQKQWEISQQFAMFATPIAYLIDTDGVVASPVAVGKDAILGLVKPS